jgi:ABC-type uncharacterized transport system involved in gliding motility auxiliary subunit
MFFQSIQKLFSPLSPRRWWGLVVVCLAVFFLALPWLRTTKVDATSERLFTLAKGTKQVLSTIKEPITFKLYYSERLGRLAPAYASYATRVTDLLQELNQQTKGKIKLQIINPTPFSEEEDRAMAYGLKALPAGEQESVFFGLVATTTTDKIEVLPFFQLDRETFLEYDLARLVERLTRERKPVVGLFSGIPIMGDSAGILSGTPSQPWMIYRQLSKEYDVRLVAADGEGMSNDFDMLILIQPRDISEQAIFMLDQYAMHKGRILAVLDPLPENELGGQNIGRPFTVLDDKLLALFKRWGVQIEKSKIVLDPTLARQITLKRGEGAERIDYLPWLGVGPKWIESKDPMTGELSGLNFASAGALEAVPGASTQFSTLVTSSDKASLVSRKVMNDLKDPSTLADLQEPLGKPVTLVAKVNGPITSLYTDQPNNPFVREAGQKFISKGEHDLRLVVIADTDFLADEQWLSLEEFYGQVVGKPKAGNGDLFFNAMDNLVGSDALVSLRSRGTGLRPFVRVNRLQSEAEVRFREQEKQLQQKLKETEAQLAQLQSGQTSPGAADAGSGQAVGVSAEQNAAIQKFRADALEIRKKLRQVQAALQADLQRLKIQLLLICTLLIPVVLLIALLVQLLLSRPKKAKLKALPVLENNHAKTA